MFKQHTILRMAIVTVRGMFLQEDNVCVKKGLRAEGFFDLDDRDPSLEDTDVS